MVEVFQTTVRSHRVANHLLRQLKGHFPSWHISLDLSDCDKVLRVESLEDPIDYSYITEIFYKSGYECKPLPD